MKYKRVDAMDIDFSVIGFGCWQASGGESWTGHSESEMIDTIHFAIDNGVNFFDTAPVYGLGNSETLVGKALKDRRDKVIIATKCGLPWQGKKVRNDVTKISILKEIDQSLRRLQTDYIDIYQVHWPTASQVPLEETMEAMQMIKESGKIRYIGISNFSAKDTKRWIDKKLLSSYQGLYNIVERNAPDYHGIDLPYRTEEEIFPHINDNNLAFFPYSPLMQGLLTDRFLSATKLSRFDVRHSNSNFKGTQFNDIKNKVKQVKEIFDYKYTMSEIALSILKDKKEVTSIISGVKNRDQLETNLKSLALSLSKEEKNKILTLLTN